MEQAELSRLLFGRAGRLRLARWILENVPAGAFFFGSEAQQGTGDVPNEIKDNLTRLLELGLLTRAQRDPGPGRRRYYQRIESPIWAIFDQALKLTNDTESAVDVPQSSKRPVGPDSERLRRRRQA
jgi:hypothetical protein